MGFQLAPKLVTFNGVMAIILRYFTPAQNSPFPQSLSSIVLSFSLVTTHWTDYGLQLFFILLGQRACRAFFSGTVC